MHRPLSASPNTSELPSDQASVPDGARRPGKIVRSTTVDLVLEAIRGKILRGELGSGEALRQEALAEELGVSRVPVREAITRLQGEGLVTVIAHKGAYVCGISVDEVRETFEMRLRLEPWIFSRAIPATTEASRDAALAIVDQMDRATESTWGPLNWRFHETLYLPSGLNLAIETLKRLNDRNERFFRFQVVNVPIRENTHREHVELVDASRAGDTRLGARLLREHLHTAMEQIVSVAENLVSRQSGREAE
ncbi:DNA-binding transcriptional regulator, GntR family [Paraburkholderia phenazinium]|jgi:DNA-binding GntR family transcriptional regulator|uniref:DNA-binding transcriptional regulator, GntR family n=1 Tax=Paraburkholderia phenazinium TaxID=60549 RepID=A0A1N6IAS1_9BURK|nr:DNA-binding transcriptional regulator, GntR family [Paraburkholderia phenazinium]